MLQLIHPPLHPLEGLLLHEEVEEPLLPVHGLLQPVLQHPQHPLLGPLRLGSWKAMDCTLLLICCQAAGTVRVRNHIATARFVLWLC